MQTLIKIFFIFLFYWIGEFLSYLMGGFVPGSVLGMLLLFLALQLKLVKVHQLDSPARALTDNMGLFFIPAGVGFCAASTLSVTGVVGTDFYTVTKKKKKRIKKL